MHLLAKYGGQTKIKRLGKTRVITFAYKHWSRNPETVIDAMFAAISGQTVQIAGAQYAELGVAMSAKDALLKTRTP
ncbi:transposase-like protein [Corynebacterium kutscheri]|uniref:Transposase-like protein n=1 Tax=Corynebacterium kutscheri TaxID=35755 RepID=A0AB38VYU8_9CORY|nr:transposase-like protein [Corynebacterium kutscheri]VEH79944.1 transposase-like protein [Corynebacterium kutscheri]